MQFCGGGEYLKKGRTRQWTAEKRAEADLLRKLVPNLENPERNMRMQKAKDHLMQLDNLMPNGTISEEEARQISVALFAEEDYSVVSGESEEIREVEHWNEIQTPMDAWALALKKEVFQTQAEAESAWMTLRKQVQPQETVDMIWHWQSLCESILLDRTQTFDQWLATNPSIEEVAAKAVERNLRKDVGQVYNELSSRFNYVEGGWRNVNAEDAWFFLTEEKKEVLPHPWLAQMWEKILVMQAAESTLQGEITKPQINKLCVLFGEKYANLTTDERHNITAAIFGKESLNDFTKAEASVLIDAMEQAGEHLKGEMESILKVLGEEEKE